MKRPRDAVLLTSFLLWLGLLGLIRQRERREQADQEQTVEIQTLAETLFGNRARGSADRTWVRRKAIWLHWPDPRQARRLGYHERVIEIEGDHARVRTRLHMTLPTAYLSKLFADFAPLLQPLVQATGATEIPIDIDSRALLSRARGLETSKAKFRVLNHVFHERHVRRDDGGFDIWVYWQGRSFKTQKLLERNEIEGGFQDVDHIKLDKEWSILVADFLAILNPTTRSHAIRHARVRVMERTTIEHEGRETAAYVVRGVSPADADLVAWYALDGRVLKEQGVFRPFGEITFVRETPTAPAVDAPKDDAQ